MRGKGAFDWVTLEISAGLFSRRAVRRRMRAMGLEFEEVRRWTRSTFLVSGHRARIGNLKTWMRMRGGAETVGRQ